MLRDFLEAESEALEEPRALPPPPEEAEEEAWERLLRQDGDSDSSEGWCRWRLDKLGKAM